jgi:hypothetical protein
MHIEPFDRATHLPKLDAWARVRGLGENIGDPELLPPVGFLVGGIACGFLYQTDSKQAYVGAIMADPATTEKQRRVALLLLLDALMAEAHARGYHAVVGLPTIAALAEKFRQMGFITVPGEYAIRRV